MPVSLSFALIALLLMFTYRLRGGGFYAFGNDTVPRIIWTLVFQFCSAFALDPRFLLGFTTSCCMFIAISAIPHAFCQAMGRNPGVDDSLRDRWPAAVIPSISQLTWNVMAQWEKTAYDYAQMTCVALLRGILVFIPYIFFTNEVARYLHAVLAIALLQPLAYLIGYWIPFSLPSLSARSTEWGELFTGLAWACSLMALTL